MAEIMQWFTTTGFNLIESVALVASICFTAVALRSDVRSRKSDNLIRITENHRVLWLYFLDHPELRRVMSAVVDLECQPITDEEETFVLLVTLHLLAAYKTTRDGLHRQFECMEADVTGFYSLPIPNATWQKIRRLQDSDFAAFVDGCLLHSRA